MSIFNWFRRKPTFSFRIAQTQRGKWIWEVVDPSASSYEVRALQPAPFHPVRAAAVAAARRFAQGLGAEYREYEGS